ncbi:unnamed protein product [Psylliodes chrysocephalus]|uniref:Uncharacterized protein n=1 Tax=Psylliodes chrysocephalus TaxID=3402493 RepID=A0A9P0D3Q8_9CUCU|nr:unnamed protein product [Psylliodes chrysocephala]
MDDITFPTLAGDPTNKIDSHENPTSNMPYSTALKQNHNQTFNLATKEQAISFLFLNNVNLQEYLYQLGAYIQPSNILFASRMLNNRICIYLSSQNIYEKFLTDNNGEITVNGECIKVRKLNSPSERLILSNIRVYPTIPHKLLTTSLQNLGKNLVSPMTFLRIGAINPHYQHILSFRRKVYITPSTNAIPENIHIQHDNTTYRIFLSADGQVCYKYKQLGHKGSDCLNQLNTQNPPQTQPVPTYSNSPPQNNQPLEPNQEINDGDESTTPTTNKSMSHCDITTVVETPTPSYTQTNTIKLISKKEQPQPSGSNKFTFNFSQNKCNVSEIESPTIEKYYQHF